MINTPRTQSVDSIQVAKPCPARWEAMQGDDRVRFCQECRLHVYNLSAMDLDEAAELISKTDGRLCVRFYRRRDGTILTRDCPVGLRAFRRRMVVARLAGAGAVAAFAAALVGSLPAQHTMGTPVMGQRMLTEQESKEIEARHPLVMRPIMGKVQLPAAPVQEMGRIAVTEPRQGR